MADAFDNIETTNACEWDEEIERGDSDKSTKKPTYKPMQRVVKEKPFHTQRDTGDTAEILTPLRKITVIGHSHNRGSTPRVLGKRLERRPGPLGGSPRKDPKRGSAETWTKQGAVNSRRMQNKLDTEAKKISKDTEFLSKVPHTSFPASGYYLWADSSVPPSDLLGENLQALDRIRVENSVHIDFDELTGCIRLCSEHLSRIEDGLDGIKAEIQHAKANDTTLMPLYLVDPPSASAMRHEVSPDLTTGQNGDSRSVIQRVILSGAMLATGQVLAWEKERQLVLKSNGQLFSGHVKKALEEFQVLRSGMRMRVHFGHIHLQLYRKDFRGGNYSFAKFSQMMSESRTKAEMDRVIGGENFIDELLNRIKDDTDLFDPMDSMTSCLSDVKPRHSLIVVACGPSKQQVRVEADIDAILCPQEGLKIPEKFAWQEGAINYYHSRRRKTRLNVGTISLERINWCLEMVTDEAMSKPPKAFQNLVQGSLSSQTTPKLDKIGLEYPSVRLRIPPGVLIDKVWIRSVLQYKLKGSCFIVQVAVYREWKDGNTTRDPLTSCGISLYNKDWDLFLGSRDGVVNTREVDVKSLFPDDSSSRGGFPEFIARVGAVQTFLGRS